MAEPQTPTQRRDEYVAWLKTLPEAQQLAIYRLADGLMAAIECCQLDGVGLRALALVSVEVAAAREDMADDAPIILLPNRSIQVVQ